MQGDATTPLARVLDRLKGVRESNGGHKALCPAHDDTDPSLSISEGSNGKVLLKCFAGCTFGDITGAIGLRSKDLRPESPNGQRNSKGRRMVVESYDYHGVEGRLLFQTLRYEPKDFRQRRPDGRGGWEWNLKGVEPVLYRLPDVLRAVESDQTVFVVEGERDAGRLRALGLVATTNPMGAGKWRESYSKTLQGANVVILPDNDGPGREHAGRVAHSLHGKAASVKVLELPDLPDKGDVSDWLDAGGTVEELERMVREAPEWTPPPKAEPARVGRLLSEVVAERVSWLWPGRIPLGKLSIIEGDPGEGKSAMTTDLAARVSMGRTWPDGAECEAGGAVICSAEDDLADTIRPRLDAAGGDASKVLALATVPDGDSERLLSIPEDLEIIRQGIERVGAKLVILDPLMAFLSGRVNSHRDQDVRRALTPLAKLAEDTGAAVVVVRHLTQSSGGNPLYRGQASIGIIGAARSALLVATHPEDEDCRVLASQKNNLAEFAPSLMFGLTEAANGAVRVEWKGDTPHTAAALLAAPTDPEERSALDEAMEFLRNALKDGPVWSKQVKKDAREADITDITLKRAKAALGVRSEKQGDGSWVWALAEGDQDPQASQEDSLDPLDSLPIDKRDSGGRNEEARGSHDPLEESRISKRDSDTRRGQGDQGNHVSRDEPPEKCIHDCPGGKGCYLCDPDHPYR